MGTYLVLKPVTLTVEPNSVVEVSDEQYELVKDYLDELREEDVMDVGDLVEDNPSEETPESEDPAAETPEEPPDLSTMTKAELTALATEKSLTVSSGMAKAEIIALLQG